MRQYIVIGAGRFGRSVAQTLLENGAEVMVIDENEEVIQQLSETMDNVAIVDVCDEHALRSIGLGNFDVAIIAIGTDLRASIMATLISKELGVHYVISKAQDSLQANVLTKIGADKVVFPENDMGMRLGKALMFDNVVDYMPLDDKHSIFEITAPKEWDGKNLLELNVREKYDLNVVAVKRFNEFEVPVDPTKSFREGDIVVVAGKSDIMERIVLREAKEENISYKNKK